MLPVSGRRAVQRLGGEGLLAQLGGDVGVVEVGEALAGFGVGQEEVPQARRLGLLLGAIEQFELARVPAPAVGLLVVEPSNSSWIGATFSAMCFFTAS